MSAPIGYTCPDINEVYASLDRVRKRLNLILADKVLDDIEEEFYSIEQQLEKLRSSNAFLRTWAESLEKKVL